MRSDVSGAFWYVYLVRCADGTLYCGVARDLTERLGAHSAGRGARYTRGRGPVVLLRASRHQGQGTALRIEAAIKRLPRAVKLTIAEDARKWAAVARGAQGGSG